MPSDAAHPQPERSEEAWHELDELVDEISQLVDSELSASQFYAALLNRIVPVLAAVGGAVWTEQPSGDLSLQYQVNLPEQQLAATADAQQRHRRLVRQVLEAGTAKAVPPRSGPVDEDQAANPTEFIVLLCPWRFGLDAAGVVELFLQRRPGTSPSAERGYLRFLTVVCELVVDFHRNRLVRESRYRMERFGRFEQFVERIHGTLDLKPTAYHIANEGRPLVGCDRLSVATVRGSRCRLLAVSGVDHVNRRANVVRHLERLCKAVAAVGEPLWHPHAAADLPPQIQGPLNEYLDVAHVRALAILPLRAPGKESPAAHRELVGALVVEQFQGGFDDRLRETVSSILGHSGAALANSLEFQRVPMLRLWRALGKVRWLLEAKRLPKTLLALLAIAGVVTALATVETDFEIAAPGEIQPLVRREIFAPYDGMVSDLQVKHGSRVRSGQTLVEIRRPELDFDFERVLGELQTARKRLAAVEAERLQEGARQTDDQRRRYSQLTAEEEELRETIGSLERQHAVLEDQRSELTISSPIDGEVLTWDLKQLLESRPVTRGQILMTVADRQGPWVLELRVPDDRVAFVLDAQRTIGPRLEVSYVLATTPGAKLHGAIERLGIRTEVAEAAGAFVLATVSVDRDEVPELVPGATVAAKIHCGRRCVGYVWLHDLIEAVQMWVLF